jgi:hypothetical protein
LKNPAVPVPHHPFYYRRARHGVQRRESLLLSFWIVLGMLAFVVLIYLIINFLVL